MTEKKRLPEQIASHTYNRQSRAEGSPEIQQTVNKREPYSPNGHNGLKVAGRLQRVVTIPTADPSAAWNTFAQRQEQRRLARTNHTRPQKYVKMASRTFAQTGTRATSGRIKAIRRSLPASHTSPVPVRSGRRPGRRNLLWRLFGVLAFMAVLGFGTHFAFTSNFFRIEQVTISGTRNGVLVQQIHRLGIQGQNIFLVNVEELTGRISASPLVASVSLSKQWPNQFTVTVAERVPALLWQTPKGVYSVDRNGVVISLTSEMAGIRPLQTVLDIRNLSNGKQLVQAGTHLHAADITFALRVFERLPQLTGINAFKLRYDGTIYANTMSDSALAGNVRSGGSYSIESPDGWIAYLGSASDLNSLENRLVELQHILAWAQKQNLQLATVDLRYGLRPVYTLKQEV